jgi:MFS family permease
VYAVYAIGVLLALLLTGGLSDLIGRRPVMVAALLGLVGAETIFMFAGGLDWLFVARWIQGLATGLLLGATGAALVDLHPRRNGAQAGLVNGIASAAGIALGALVSSLLVQYSPDPEVTPFVVIALLAALGAWAAWRLPETVASSGERISLTPRVPRVPRHLWRTFGLSGLGVLASWSVGGLYLSLGPAIIGQLHPTQNHAVGGLFVFVFCACAVLAQIVLRDVPNRPIVVGGSGLLAVGSVITAATVSAGSLDGFLLGSLLVGFGFGATFMGALRTLSSMLPPAHRAGVMAAFFVVAYFAISVPAIAAGIAAVHIGLASAATWFGCAVAVVAALVSIVGWFELRPAREAPQAELGR